MAEVQEGEEVRAGVPVVDVVNPKTMRVRARVNQADINELRSISPSRSASTRIPSCPSTAGSPRSRRSAWSRRCRRKSRRLRRADPGQRFAPKLMPDLTASLDVTLSRLPGALVVPRDAVGTTANARSCACSAAPRIRNRRDRRGDERARRRADVRRRRRRRRREERCAIRPS